MGVSIGGLNAIHRSRLMSAMRRTCELSSRRDAPHPMQMNEHDCVSYHNKIIYLWGKRKICTTKRLEGGKQLNMELYLGQVSFASSQSTRPRSAHSTRLRKSHYRPSSNLRTLCFRSLGSFRGKSGCVDLLRLEDDCSVWTWRLRTALFF